MEYPLQPSPTRKASSQYSDVPGYAQGLWTPSLGGNTTYVDRWGKFTIIGNLCFIRGHVGVNVLGTGNTNTLLGLPRPVLISDILSSSPPINISYLQSSALNVVHIVLNAVANTSTMVVFGLTAAGATFSILDVFGNSTIMDFAGFYEMDLR